MHLKNNFLVALTTIASFAAASPTSSADTPCYDSAPGLCHVSGTLKDPKELRYTTFEIQLASQPANSVTDCEARCRQFQGKCKSFAWYPDKQFCQIFKKTLAKQDFVAGQSADGEFYYDQKCFNCLNTCPRPLGEDQLVNGGFDDFADSISPWISLVEFKVVTPGYNSKRAYSIKKPITGSSYVAQKYFGCEDDYYLTTLDYKNVWKGSNEGIGISVDLGIVSYSVEGQPVEQNNTWVSVSTLLRSPANGGKQLNIVPSPGFEFYMDNVKSVPVNPQIVPSTPNLISNPGFESDSSSGYTVSNNCSVVSPGYQSDRALECLSTQDEIHPLTVSPTLDPLLTNTPYIMSFDYKITRYNKDQTCYIRATVGPHLEYYLIGSYQNRVSNNTWTAETFSFILHSSTSDVELLMYGENDQGDRCDFTLDNMTLKEASF